MTKENKENKNSGVIKIRKSTFWKGLVVALTVALITLLVYAFMLGGSNSAGSDVQDKAVQPAQAAQPSDAQSVPSQQTGSVVDMVALMDDDAVKGSANAPVTIVEWSDFECPFCARFYVQTLGRIRKDYIETGKVKMVYRDFPLSFHPNAQKAAEAAECADEQGKFWEMHDVLFEEGVSGGVDSFKQYAEDIGLDTAEFNDCLDSGKMASETAKDMRDGQAEGITGTPGFIINGKLVIGAQPFDVFQQVIEEELAR